MTGAESLFPTVVFAVVAAGCIVAVWSAAGIASLYERIGEGGLDVPFAAPAPTPGTAQARAERSEEIRQMLEATSRSRQMRGLPPLADNQPDRMQARAGIADGDALWIAREVSALRSAA